MSRKVKLNGTNKGRAQIILFHSNIRLSITLYDNILDVCKHYTDCSRGTICQDGHCVKGNQFEVYEPYILIRTIIRIEVMLCNNISVACQGHGNCNKGAICRASVCVPGN